MKKITNLKLFMIAVIILSFLTFSLFSALHVHTCMGEDCPVCQLIDSIRRILGIGIAICLFHTTAHNVQFIGRKQSAHNKRTESLVLQRVKITS